MCWSISSRILVPIWILAAGGFTSDLHAQVGPRVRVLEIVSERELSAIADQALFRPGDVIVLADAKLTRPQFLSSSLVPSDDEPTYLVGRAYYLHVLKKYGLTKTDLEEYREARALLVKKAVQTRKLSEKPGARVEPEHLTPLSLSQITFLHGNWVFSGFDLSAHTDRGTLIVIGGSSVDARARVQLVGNRLSNCDAGFRNCKWSKVLNNGTRRNGGTLVRVRASGAGSVISNNLFEYLRGFLLIFVENGATGTEIVANTFRHLETWGDNAAEAVHLGVVPSVKGPNDAPSFSYLNSIVAFNLFENASAENELIGVKSSGNHIVGNRISDSRSGISLRDGSDTVIEDNTIIRSYGIRVMGDRQIIRNNHISLPINNFGIWFENGAGRAGYECTTVSVGERKVWIQSEPLRWLYRPARAPVVSGNLIEVPQGGEAHAIARRNVEKSCAWERCDGNLSSRIPCDRQLSDAEMDAILSPAAVNEIRTVRHP